MEFPEISEVKQAAARRVGQTENATRLVAIFAGVPALISLVLTLLSYGLSHQIAGTGGLGGLGLRSVLETAQNMLQVLDSVFTVFWGFGLVAVTLRWAVGEGARDGDLLAGFRHWGPVLRGTILKGLVYLAAVLLASQLSSVIFVMTPLSDNMTELVEKMMSDPAFAPTQTQMLDVMLPYLPFFGIVLAAFVIPLSYRLRMMDYVLMDEPKLGAFYALRTSLAMTKRNCIRLFRLDLSFWWFYLLEVCTVAVFYGDLLMELAGVEIGMSANILLFVACAAGLTLQTALYIWRRNQVATTYAMVYERLKPRPQEN